ncbi:MAG: hypothetical protein FJ026_02285 [Chloroflexi bacterium]|nr:hypothetical protein [Chloroflexota bacterium]
MKGQDQRQSFFRWVLWGLLVIGILVVSCGKKSQEAAVVGPPSQVRRNLDGVWAGPAGTSLPPKLTSSGWKSLPAGGWVRTDAAGEAELAFSGCQHIYVFDNGSLMTSTCHEKELGTSLCSQAGGTILVNCTGQVKFQTLAANIQLGGTWVAVLHLPEVQLTLVAVLEGSATVWPVLDLATGQLGPGIRVLAGQGVYTAPDLLLIRYPDWQQLLPARQPLPVRELQPLIERLNADQWLEKVLDLALRQGFPPEIWPLAVELWLECGGGPLEDQALVRAVLHGAPWSDMINATVGPDVPLWATVEAERVDARSVPYEPAQAREWLIVAGHPEGKGLPDVALLFPAGDGQLAEMAEQAAEYLATVPIPVVLLPTSPGALAGKLAALISSGQPAMSLSWR